MVTIIHVGDADCTTHTLNYDELKQMKHGSFSSVMTPWLHPIAYYYHTETLPSVYPLLRHLEREWRSQTIVSIAS